jgi:hypothetical protein
VFSLFAQNPVVSGRVTDSTGAVIGGATVELTSRATAIKYQSQTNGEGYFVMPPVPPGVYDIEARMQGFAASRIDGFTLEVGQQRTINLSLKPGEITTASRLSTLLVITPAPSLPPAEFDLWHLLKRRTSANRI